MASGGVPQDLATAVKLVRLAANQGYVRAQFNLGLSYDTGTGVPQDSAQAASWFRRAAKQGDPAAQQNLGVMYANGDGVPRDMVAAHVWLTLAATQTTGAARAGVLQGRDVVAQQLTPAQRTVADRVARDWIPQPER